MNVTLVVLLLVIIVPLPFVFALISSLIELRSQIKTSWSQIEVQMTRRHELLPQFVTEVSKTLEDEVIELVTSARENSVNAATKQDLAKAAGILSEAVRVLFAEVGKHPKVSASERVRTMKEELMGVETKIAYTWSFYNDVVARYNHKIQRFPNNLIVRMLGFKREQPFAGDEQDPVTK